MEVQRRPTQAEDAEFLFSVYASTRTEELASTGWGANQMEAFLRMQFRAQDTHYRAHYPGYCFEIVQVDRIDVGRLYTHWDDRELHILDLALLPTHRRTGIGTHLLTSLLAEAKGREGKARIFVENFNPAKNLYHRLGFREVGSDGVYAEMLWDHVKDVS